MTRVLRAEFQRGGCYTEKYPRTDEGPPNSQSADQNMHAKKLPKAQGKILQED